MKNRLLFLAALFLLVAFFTLDGVGRRNMAIGWFRGVWRSWVNDEELHDLRTENQALKARVLELSHGILLPPDGSLNVRVFSSYPFNNKNLLAVNAGFRQGIRQGMPATIGGAILVGQVHKTFKNYSLVRTIFSPDWELPVRIGAKKIPALLIGGPNLKLTMIVNDQPIFDGQPIFVASKDFPYGMKIGEAINVKSDSVTGVFQETGVKTDYDFDGLTELAILLWTAD